ncbi:hypothetical protein MTR67_003679 [Solanum verrucosum]|uniref:Uncharacterized protein n=1 Tax=Solanum verrucosum TaxID=315347 RepID=A0AAF0PYI3_SOLVR|nr:hypothetical protein MTR67_003679 [Solanum verrucosum]
MRRPNGHRRIEIARNQNQTNLQVTFSIVDRFLEGNPTPSIDDPNPIIVAHQNANVDEINRKLKKLERQLERERKHGQALQALRTEPSHEKLRNFHLKILCEALEDVDEEVERVARKLMECGIEFLFIKPLEVRSLL